MRMHLNWVGSLAVSTAIGASASTSAAMPVPSLNHVQSGMTIYVAGGCGAGFHR